MIYIRDPEGHVYVDPQTVSAVALDHAVCKFNPSILRLHRKSFHRKTVARKTWEMMKQQGFTIMEQSADSTGDSNGTV